MVRCTGCGVPGRIAAWSARARASDEPPPAAVRDAVAAAMAGGATMDAIVGRVRARGSEHTLATEGRCGAGMDGLIGLQRATDRFVEEWTRTREPGAEGRAALVAIETLRALALRTVAALNQRAEPASTTELGRLSLALQRIESTDRLRIERERSMAEAAADPEPPAARASPTTHEENVAAVRRAMEGVPFPWNPGPPPASEGDSAAHEDDPAAPPNPAPAPPFDDAGAPDAWSAGSAQEATGEGETRVTESARDAGESPETWDARMTRDERDVGGAPDDEEWGVAHDLEMRRRDAARPLWPPGAPF